MTTKATPTASFTLTPPKNGSTAMTVRILSVMFIRMAVKTNMNTTIMTICLNMRDPQNPQRRNHRLPLERLQPTH